MHKKILSILLMMFTGILFAGCDKKDPLSFQAEQYLKTLSKKPADLYDEHFSNENVYVHLHKLSKNELKEYYYRAETTLYNVYFTSITNKNNKNIILSIPATSVTNKKGEKKVVGNNLPKLMNKSNESGIKKAFTGLGYIPLALVTWGTGPMAATQANATPKDKGKELYYQTTYNKGLQSVVIKPYETVAGFFVLDDYPFQTYESINFKFQKTQKMEYFEIKYPTYYADGLYAAKLEKERKAQEKVRMKEIKIKQKEAREAQELKQKELEGKLKEMKKNKNL